MKLNKYKIYLYLDYEIEDHSFDHAFGTERVYVTNFYLSDYGVDEIGEIDETALLEELEPADVVLEWYVNQLDISIQEYEDYGVSDIFYGTEINGELWLLA